MPCTAFDNGYRSGNRVGGSFKVSPWHGQTLFSKKAVNARRLAFGAKKIPQSYHTKL